MLTLLFTPKYFHCFEGNVSNTSVTCKRPHRQRAIVRHIVLCVFFFFFFFFFYNYIVLENHSVQSSPF